MTDKVMEDEDRVFTEEDFVWAKKEKIGPVLGAVVVFIGGLIYFWFWLKILGG